MRGRGTSIDRRAPLPRHGRLLVLLLVAPGAFAAGSPWPTPDSRLEDLERLLGHAKSTDAELIAAIDAVALACADLAPDADARERKRFRDGAATALLKALRLEHVDEATKRNERNEVQLAAARALRHVDRDKAQDLMRVLEQHILKDRDYGVDPSFYDAVFDPLVRLQAKGTFEWLLDKAVNPDTATDSRNQAVAGIDALLRLPCTGEQRCAAVKRLLAIYQSYAYQVEDVSFDVAGFRSGRTSFAQNAGAYWETVRPTVLRALRELSTDPRTGLPPLDLDTKGEIPTLGRHKVWFGQNKTLGHAPWIDAEPEPRARDAFPYTLPLSPSWLSLGVPWTASWRTNRGILDGAMTVAPGATSCARRRCRRSRRPRSRTPPGRCARPRPSRWAGSPRPARRRSSRSASAAIRWRPCARRRCSDSSSSPTATSATSSARWRRTRREPSRPRVRRPRARPSEGRGAPARLRRRRERGRDRTRPRRLRRARARPCGRAAVGDRGAPRRPSAARGAPWPGGQRAARAQGPGRFARHPPGLQGACRSRRARRWPRLRSPSPPVSPRRTT